MDSTRGSVINHHMNRLAMVIRRRFLVERPLGGRFRLCGNVAVGRKKKKRGDGQQLGP